MYQHHHPAPDVAQTLRATLRFVRSELLYDIASIAFVEGDILPTEDEHARHQIIDITEDGNVDRVSRILSLAFAEVVHMLYPYVHKPHEDGHSESDILTQPDEYIIHMLVPEGYAESTRVLLCRQIHEYLVCRVLADWLSITHPHKADTWAYKCEEAKAGINRAKSYLIGRIRRRQTPF